MGADVWTLQGWGVGGHKYTLLNEDTCMSSAVGDREHLGGGAADVGHVDVWGGGMCVWHQAVLGTGDRAVNKTQTRPLGADILVEEFRS